MFTVTLMRRPYMTPEEHMVHIRPPNSHHSHLRICPTVAPRLEPRHIRNRCQVSVARRW